MWTFHGPLEQNYLFVPPSLVGPNGAQLLDFCYPAFQSWFAVEYSSCCISLMNLNLYVRCFDSLMSRSPSRGPNNFYVYMNQGRTEGEVAVA